VTADGDALRDDSWWDRAACKGVDVSVFFPERGHSAAQAKRLCDSCSARSECFDFAESRDEQWGVWGGEGETERRARRRAERREQQKPRTASDVAGLLRAAGQGSDPETTNSAPAPPKRDGGNADLSRSA
jgi:hypothetical protein